MNDEMMYTDRKDCMWLFLSLSSFTGLGRNFTIELNDYIEDLCCIHVHRHSHLCQISCRLERNTKIGKDLPFLLNRKHLEATN